MGGHTPETGEYSVAFEYRTHVNLSLKFEWIVAHLMQGNVPWHSSYGTLANLSLKFEVDDCTHDDVECSLEFEL